MLRQPGSVTDPMLHRFLPHHSKNYGSAMSINSIGSGSNVVCAESRDDGSFFSGDSIKAIFKDYVQR